MNICLIFLLVTIGTWQTTNGITCEYEHRVDYDDIESQLFTTDVPNLSFDSTLALDGAGAGNKIVVSYFHHPYYLVDFTYPVAVKNVSMRILFGINITLEVIPSGGGSSSFFTESLPNFSWNNAEFTGINIADVSQIKITFNMDPFGAEMGIKRLYVTVCPECSGTTETIDYSNTAGLTLEVLPLPFANPTNLLAGSGKKRKVSTPISNPLLRIKSLGKATLKARSPRVTRDPKAIEATFSSAITIQMVRLQMRVQGSSTFNVTLYSSTTTTFANQLYTDQQAVPVIGPWNNDLHVIPFAPVQDVKKIIITFTFPSNGFVKVRNLAFDKCI